ncbi:RAMP superfamily CRISPR-associated protein [Microcoleus sp. FACHB-1515]|uniref:RAMP superfamily CRISPR-associated protein n=1 Tax=Microcoleus sp. FACHB-1515 TaxID=2692821 RepID=UPI001F54D0A1|nr:RAMP superfamily CRISPR-associated protein [Microcoleus sp. FACHB-1515]
MNRRTRLIAGAENCLEVSCPWRIRVGGHRGPESILLPAFDAVGMPYIPSSTLRGVARTQAIRHFMQTEQLSWKAAEARIAPFFGSLEAAAGDRIGKVIFLDAYPMPEKSDRGGGLAVDIANNIWSWQDNQINYKPNPNLYFSLRKATFLMGIRAGTGCTPAILQQVKAWLIAGLAEGIGSQVNTGYGTLQAHGANTARSSLLEVDFTLEGQLIHGRQQFTPWKQSERGQWQMRGKPDAEVRATAFKSMLRYWFRTFAMGVLSIEAVRSLEAEIFGSIDPQKRGYLRVEVLDDRIVQPEATQKNDRCGEQSGRLRLSLSSETAAAKAEAVQNLARNLTWLMFHLGGVGQGARRPCYSRSTRKHAPWWRGSTLIAESDDAFWKIPESIAEFKTLFQTRLRAFYHALNQLSGKAIDPARPRTVAQPVEAIDSTARIVVCSGKEDFDKPYALAVLHHQDFKVRGKYDPDLCGGTTPTVKPSPVWIADLGDYQVVTVFKANDNPRKNYLTRVQRSTSHRLWPL